MLAVFGNGKQVACTDILTIFRETHGTWKKPGDEERIEEIKKEFPIVQTLEGQPKEEKPV
jgi:hypothetical protein